MGRARRPGKLHVHVLGTSDARDRVGRFIRTSQWNDIWLLSSSGSSSGVHISMRYCMVAQIALASSAKGTLRLQALKGVIKAYVDTQFPFIHCNILTSIIGTQVRRYGGVASWLECGVTVTIMAMLIFTTLELKQRQMPSSSRSIHEYWV